MTSALLRGSLIAATVASLLSSTPVLAQSAAQPVAGGLEEIVVTATRRAERLQDVPISVSAFSQEKIDSQGLKNIDDLTRLTPGVTFQRNGMGSSANYNDENSDINIRGVDSSAGSPTVGVYVDDTPIQSRHIGFGAVTAFPQLFDVDRVEVLRGPQGTLFGAGAEGGAVRFITPEPSLTQNSGYARAELAQTEYGGTSYEFGAAVGGPIIDNTLAFRVSASYRYDGGWVDRVSYTRPDPADPLSLPVYAATSDTNTNWSYTKTARAALKWQANENLSIEPSIYVQELHINDTAAYWEAISNPSAGVYRNGNALTNPSTDPFYIAAIKLNGDLGFATLSSNTSYYSRDQHSISDYTQYLRATWFLFQELPNGYPQKGDGGYAVFGDKQNNFYQEIRVASKDAAATVTWNGGVFFAHTNENIPENIYDPTLNAETAAYVGEPPGGPFTACPAATPCPGGLISLGPLDRIVEKQIALFGELSWKIVDTVKATVGLRVSKIDIDGASAVSGAFSVLPLYPLTVLTASSSEKPVTPKFALAYQPDRDDMYYISAEKGYRSGGVNAPVSFSCDGNLETVGLPIGADGHPHVPESYSSDSLWSYEIGAKNTVLDHRLQINSSLFIVNWKNIQQNVYLPSCGEQFAANLGQVQSRGGDIDVTYKPVNALTLNVTAAYTDAKYTRASCAGTLEFTGAGLGCNGATAPSTGVAPIVSQGDRLVGAPWTVLLSGEYASPLEALGGRTGYLRVDYQETSQQTALLPGQNFHNALFDDTIPGLPETKNLQLRAGLRFSGFDVSLFANNVLNDHPLLYSSRDIAANCASGAPCGPTGNTDNLYFGRGVRPRTVGITATYRY